jgi:hypothetical protein
METNSQEPERVTVGAKPALFEAAALVLRSLATVGKGALRAT